MAQYCRYCAFCFDADLFGCSNENGIHYGLYMTEKKIKRPNKCPEYQYTDLGDVITGRQYHPIAERKAPHKKINQPKLF